MCWGSGAWRHRPPKAAGSRRNFTNLPSSTHHTAVLATATPHHPHHHLDVFAPHSDACGHPDLDADVSGLGKKKHGHFFIECDGDVTGFGGGAAAAEAHRLLTLHANTSSSSWSSRIIKRVCHGTLKLAWSCPSHRAEACAECKGTHVWVKAPCGATVAVCDGLQHTYGKAVLEGGKREDGSSTKLYMGSGALGVSTLVKAPPPRGGKHDAAADADADAGGAHAHAHADVGNKHDPLPVGKRRTVAHWSHEGIAGRVVSHKALDWHHGSASNDLGDGSSLATEAKAAFAEDGLVLLPPGADVGAAVVSAEPEHEHVAASNVTGRPSFTFRCNGEKSFPIVPCVGSSVFKMESDGAHPEIRSTCDGGWSGRLGYTCAGLHTARSDYPTHSDNGHHAASLRTHAQCSGKHGARFIGGGKGMASWCKGRAAGAALVKGRCCKGDEGVAPK